ncbi:MAG TPA: hypothetical protein VID26_06705 [Candidatus Limnocylindrales bacterium]|jgi:hypothetical protein
MARPSPDASPVASAPAAGAPRLVALVGTVGAMALVAADVRGGGLGPIDRVTLPPDAAWLSGDGSSFVVTTLDGRLLVGSLTDLAPPPGTLAGSQPLRAFATLEPASAAAGIPGQRRLAFVEGNPGSGGPGRVTVAAWDGGETRSITLARPAEGAPAWLPDGRLAVVGRDRADRPETLLVDPQTGRITTLDVPPPRSIGTAAGVVATIDAGGIAHAGRVAAWLAGVAPPALPGGSTEGAALVAVPSPDGQELAIVLADANGDAAAIRIVALDRPWHEIARFELPRGANRAVVSWLAVR